MEKSAWHPDKVEQRISALMLRDRVMTTIRSFFRNKNFLEVETPVLQRSPGLEPHLFAFKTELTKPDSRSAHEFYLHTSPEFAMKKLLVGGLQNIFQIARVFRNNEGSNTHHSEFSMLEWYRRGVDYKAIMHDAEALVKNCAAELQLSEITWNATKCDLSADWQKISVQDLFLERTGIDLFATIDDPQNPKRELLAEKAREIGVICQDRDSWEDIFFRIFLEKIEKSLGVGKPTIVYDYPISMAALSRAKSQDPSVAERFEIYICGLELANAFSELTDARVQAHRFALDMQKKEELYGYRYPIDFDFIAALEFGLPDCAGIALGVDRLVMLLAGAEDIEDVLWLPVSN